MAFIEVGSFLREDPRVSAASYGHGIGRGFWIECRGACDRAS
jgi:hypothetical protein